MSQRIQPKTAVVLALKASASMAPGRLAGENPCPYHGVGRRKPAQFGPSSAVSTGNSLRGRQIQRRRGILRLMSRCPRHYPLRSLVTWAKQVSAGAAVCASGITSELLRRISKRTTWLSFRFNPSVASNQVTFRQSSASLGVCVELSSFCLPFSASRYRCAYLPVLQQWASTAPICKTCLHPYNRIPGARTIAATMRPPWQKPVNFVRPGTNVRPHCRTWCPVSCSPLPFLLHMRNVPRSPQLHVGPPGAVWRPPALS